MVKTKNFFMLLKFKILLFANLSAKLQKLLYKIVQKLVKSVQNIKI